MNYFRLIDDVGVPGRWHLGEVVDSMGISNECRDGARIASEMSFQISIEQEGNPLEFCLTSFGVPIGSNRVGRAIESVASADIQRLNATIGVRGDFEVLNSVRLVECLDEARSEFLKWTENDFRSDLAGEYRMVSKLRIDSKKVPQDAHFFRIKGWRIALIVSEQVKSRMEEVGCNGAIFQGVV